MKGIQLNDILNSPLNQERVKVSGIDGLKKLADVQAAQVTRGKEKQSVIQITHSCGDTTINISLSNVHEVPAALLAIGYTKKGILTRIKEWLI